MEPVKRDLLTPYDLYSYKSGPQVYKIGEFIVCQYQNALGFPEEDFGWITDLVPPNAYTVKLLTEDRSVVVPNELIRKAGQA